MPKLGQFFLANGLVGSVAEALPEVAAVAKLALHWRDLARELVQLGEQAELETTEKFIAFLSGAIDRPAVDQVFAALDLTPLLDDLKRNAASLADGDSRWGKLLSPSSRFGEQYVGTAAAENNWYDAGDGTAAFALALPPLGAQGAASAAPASVHFAAEARAALEIEPGALWPFPKDPVAPGLLRIGATGALEGQAGSALPFGALGSGAASAEAAVEADFSLFYRPAGADLPVASALLSALSALPDPCDLAGIRQSVALAQLEGLVMRFGGRAKASLSVALGKDLSIPELLTGHVGITASLAFNRSAHWLLSLAKAADGSLRFVVSRDRLSEREWAVGVGIEIDPSGLVEKLHAALVDASGRWGDTLDQIKPWLTPGAVVRKALGEQVASLAGELTADLEFSAALALDAGLLAVPDAGGDTSALAVLIEDRIAGAFDGAGKTLVDKAEDLGSAVFGRLLASVPTLARDSLRLLAEPRIAALAGAAKQAFDGQLASLVPSEEVAKKVNGELKAAGVALQGDLGAVDQALAGMRDLTVRFDGLLKRLVAETADTVKFRLTARAGWDGAESEGSQYEIRGSISADNAETRAVWNALATGRFDPVQALFGNPDAVPEGLTLDPDSSIARTASSRRGFAAELIVMGLSLGLRDIVAGTATIARTAGGDVTVHGEGLAEHEVSNLKESRKASFLSVWDLARHKADPAQRGGFGLSLQLDHRDENLTPEEVKGLFEGCAALGLIDPSRRIAAEAVYQRWTVAAAASGGLPQGSIAFRMVLPARAIDRMLATGRLLRTDPPELERQLFGQAVAAMIAAGFRTQKLVESDARDARQDFAAVATIDDPVDMMFRLRGSLKQLAKVNDGGGPLLQFHGPHYLAFRGLIARANSFVGDPAQKLPGLMEAMANIVDATPFDAANPAPDAWTEQTYRDAGLFLASVTHPWLKANMELGKVRERLDPLLLAFMLLLARFAAPEPAPVAAPRAADALPDPRWANALFRITMTPVGGAPVMI